MKTILHIDSSARRGDNPVSGHGSISRRLGARFIREWTQHSSAHRVIHRDVGLCPPPFISQDWIAAAFTPPAQRSPAQVELLALSDQLIDEVRRADVIVITAPMYNYGMPAALKAWFDQIVRVNETFTFDLDRGDFPLAPVFSGKTLVLLASTGEFGFGLGGVREHMNHLGPHIEVLGHYLGVERFHEIRVEYQEFGDDRHAASIERARRAVVDLAGELIGSTPKKWPPDTASAALR
ncbi:FMN-dependent NADH-azoreductase [Parahaliea mediterranea]|uniref:FMN dependent NADH:quinone oxidoreductase n=1 Tax=Parahaliea mediterranea TaxID=651086 RepID=A0A939ILN0_9GAMM|nr:NAD(P)H-dependent oxidoreductase [Parahaliea mediterranea]MBN7798556.1 NAD(P)H-dependent oxidoreductase [Parahaliea mediterranea]